MLDESALLLELEDVYWTEEGVLSVQIVFAAMAMLAALAYLIRMLRTTEGQDCETDWELAAKAWDDLQMISRRRRARHRAVVRLEHVAVVVDDYDEAIEFFVGALGFELVEDSPATTNDGRPKRWVVVRPPGAQTGLLLAQADGERAGRRGMHWHGVAARAELVRSGDDVVARADRGGARRVDQFDAS